MSFLRPFKGSQGIPGADERDELVLIRENMLQVVLVLGSLMTTLAYFSAIYALILGHSWVMVALQSAAYVLVLVATLVPRLGYRFRVYTILFLLYLMGIATIAESGLAGDGRLYLVLFVVLSMLLLEFRQGLRLFGLAVLSGFVVAILMVRGAIPAPSPAVIEDSTRATDWITGGLVFVMLAGLAVSALYTLIRGLERALYKQRQLGGDLQAERSGLEQRVALRTIEVEKRAVQLEAAGRFAQEIAKMNAAGPMFDLTLSTFQFQLNFHHVLVYQLEPAGEGYLLKNASGEIGQALLEQQNRIPADEAGTIGELITQGETCLLRNSGEEARYFKSQALSDVTRAVLLPFRGSGAISGAVFLPSTSYDELSETDLNIYQGIADQLGISLEKAQLNAILQRNIEELQASSRQAARQTWRSYLGAGQRKYAYRFNRAIIDMEAPAHSEAVEALEEEHPVVTSVKLDDDSGKPMTAVAVPILLRDQTLGVIDVRFSSQAVPPDLVNLIEATTKRLALALENARLMDEMKQRAEREHIISHISSKVRASSDIDGILKSTALEIGRSLGVSEVQVQLRADKESPAMLHPEVP